MEGHKKFDREEFAARLRALREKKGFTQKELADEMKVSRSTIANWESHQRTPDAETIVKLAEFYKTTTDYLLTDIDSNNVNTHRHIGLYNDAINNLCKIKETDKTGEDMKALSILLMTPEFTNALLGIMSLPYSYRGPYYAYTHSADDKLIQVTMSPDSLREFLSTQLIDVVKYLARRKKPVFNDYEPAYEYYDEKLKEYIKQGDLSYNEQGQLISRGSTEYGKKTRES